MSLSSGCACDGNLTRAGARQLNRLCRLSWFDSPAGDALTPAGRAGRGKPGGRPASTGRNLTRGFTVLDDSGAKIPRLPAHHARF